MRNEHPDNPHGTLQNYIENGFMALKKYKSNSYEYKNYYDLLDDLRYAQFYDLLICKLKKNKISFFQQTEETIEIINFFNLIKEYNLEDVFDLVYNEDNAYKKITKKIKKQQLSHILPQSTKNKKVEI